MSDKLKDVALKLDEIEVNISELKNHIKDVIDYVQSQCSTMDRADNVETTDGEQKE